MPEIFFHPDGPVLRFQRKNAVKEEQKNKNYANGYQQSSIVQPVIITKTPEQIIYRANGSNQDKSRKKEMKKGNEAFVGFIILSHDNDKWIMISD